MIAGSTEGQGSADEPTAENPNLLIAIGASAGGLRAMTPIFERLPENFQAAIVVATHRPPDRRNLLAEVLQRHTRLRVLEPIDGDHITCTGVYVGRGQETVEVEGDHLQIGIDHDRLRALKRIDDLFVSVAESAGSNAVGVVLSGMLYDGTAGLAAIHEAGGRCIVQEPRDAAFKSMPENALAAVPIDFVGTSEEIGDKLVEFAAGRHCQ